MDSSFQDNGDDGDGLSRHKNRWKDEQYQVIGNNVWKRFI